MYSSAGKQGENYIVMETTKQIGDKGEDLAVKYLKKKKYEIITRNFRTRYGEIDIIAIDEDMLVFIEVKAKSSDKFGSPADMITPKKLDKIKKTAKHYLQEKELGNIPWRIDAILIKDEKLEHLKSITL